MSGFIILSAIYCAVRGAWVVGIEFCDAVVEIVAVMRAARKRRA